MIQKIRKIFGAESHMLRRSLEAGLCVTLLKKILMLIGAASCIAAMGWLLLFLLRAFLVATDIVATQMSPDKSVTATMFRDNGGATTSFSYRVMLQPAGEEAEEVFSAYRAENIRLEWKSN